MAILLFLAAHPRRAMLEPSVTAHSREVSIVFALILAALALLGSTVWVVLNRPLARDTARADHVSIRLLTASALTLAAGVAYGLHGLV
jgi:predicted membrane channel-forming protein YqfA (hemolysin III family)